MQLPPRSGVSLRGPIAFPFGRPNVGNNNNNKNNNGRAWTAGALAIGLGSTAVVYSFFRPQDAVAAETKKLSGPAYWQNTWEKSMTGWHLKEVHKTLKKFEKQWLGDGGRVLVPLCGKTIDMPYIAKLKGVTEVVGVEYVPKAIEEFAVENPSVKLVKAAKKQGSFLLWTGEKLTILVGDFFKFTDGQKFQKVWDRGALTALEPAARLKYVPVVLNALAPGGTILLNVFERVAGSPEAIANGPPFNTPEADVYKLYGKTCTVKRVDTIDVTNPQWKERGLTKVNEAVYLITKNA